MTTIATRQLQSGANLTIIGDKAPIKFDAELDMNLGGYDRVCFLLDGQEMATLPGFMTISRSPIKGAPAWVAGAVRMSDDRLLPLTLGECDAIDAYLAPARAAIKAIRADNAAKRADIAKKARAYDNLHNEGGEGYNPYR